MNTDGTNRELRELADAIQSACTDRDMDRRRRLERAFVEVSSGAREFSVEEMRDNAHLYLFGDSEVPGVGIDRYPSFMEVCHDDPHPEAAAVRDVLAMIIMNQVDGRNWSIGRACDELERAAARYITHRGIR